MLEQRLNLNVSAIDYDKTSREITSTLHALEEMVHSENDFVITDSEFAFGWHFYVVSVNRELIQKLADQMGQDFDNLIQMDVVNLNRADGGIIINPCHND